MLCVLSGIKFLTLITGKTLHSDKSVIDYLKKQRPSLSRVQSVDECDFILVFCPIVSRAGTDIDAALQKLNKTSGTAKDFYCILVGGKILCTDLTSEMFLGNKPAILVVLHYTINPDACVPDSRRFIKRENTMVVDCLFDEDGLWKCQKNNESLDMITAELNKQNSHKVNKSTDADPQITQGSNKSLNEGITDV